jgi:adenylate cyclase
VVVFDVMFEDPRDPEQDGAFAEAIRRAQNVILFQYLERELLRSADGAVLADVQRMRDPLPLLAGAAAGLAPFPLPKAGARVDHVWLFKRGAGDVPTMPSVALQQYALQHWPDWAVLLRAALADAPAGHEGPRAAGGLPSEVSKHAPDGAEPDVALLTAATRALFQRHPQLAPRLRAALGAADLEPATRRTLGALVHLYAEPGDRTLDHYGGAGALATLPYHQVLSAPRRAQARLRGRAVFIG